MQREMPYSLRLDFDRMVPTVTNVIIFAPAAATSARRYARSRLTIAVITAVAVITGCCCGHAAEMHRVVVLDNIQPPSLPSVPSKIVLVDVESSARVNEALVGYTPDLTVSTQGDRLAVLSSYTVGGVGEPNNRLEVFRADDLSKIHSAALPFAARARYTLWPRFQPMQFSPDAEQIVDQRMVSRLTSENPPLTYDELELLTVSFGISDEGLFTQVGHGVRIPRCRYVRFLRASDWPKVHVWNSYLGTVNVIDLMDGTILSQLRIHDNPALSRLSLDNLEKPEIGAAMVLLLSPRKGTVIPGGDRFAYYVPHQPGYIRKIDLAANPPRIVVEGPEQADLDSEISAASDVGGALYAALKGEAVGPAKSRLKSRRLRIFNTINLKPQREVELSIDCDQLEVSRDGKYVYALDRDRAKIAVVEVSSGRELKLIHLGGFPVLAIPVTEVLRNN